MRNKKYLLFLLLCSGTAFGQPAETACNDKETFMMHAADARQQLKEQKCVVIDATSSYDSLSAEIHFRWNLGDGNTANGLKVKHCYDSYGNYQATLDILTTKGEILTLDEMVLEIFIKEPVEIELIVPDTLQVNEEFNPRWEISRLFTYQQKQVLFFFGDGHYGCEPNLKYRYKNPGHYNIKMLMILSHKDGDVSIIAEKIVYVKGYNIIGKELHAYFDQYLDTPAVDYLKEPVQVYLLNENHETISWREIQLDEHLYLSIPNDQPANLFIWRAHQLMKPIYIPAGIDSIKPEFIISNINNNLTTEPLCLKSLYFNLNEVTLNQQNKSILKENVRLLRTLPSPVVKIGSYTHSGGMRGITDQYALDRSEYIKSEINKALNKNTGTNIDLVDQTTVLFNTCFDNPLCGQEMQYLNGRTDLKIIAIGKN